jgi:hypothetical protein
VSLYLIGGEAFEGAASMVVGEKETAGVDRGLARGLAQSEVVLWKEGNVAYAFDSKPDFADFAVGLPRLAGKDAVDCVADRHYMG